MMNGLILIGIYKANFLRSFFESLHPLSQKMAMVYNLVDRAINLASKKFQDNNIKKVKTLLKNNSYPEKFIEKYIKIRLNKIK